MPFATFLLAAALAVEPMPPDDPAIVVCELMVRQALRKPESFVRLAAPVVTANTVALAFSFLDARGRTVSDRRECRFHLAADGRYHIEAFRRDYLARRMAAAQAKLGKTMRNNDLMLVRSEILDIGREMYVQDERRKKAERLASKAGIYPIAPARTGLKAE